MASVTIEGLPELKKKFGELTDKQQRGVLRTAIRAGGTMVAREAKRLVPVKTGALKKSIGVKVSVKQGGVTEATIGFGRRQYYGLMVELGHSQVFRTKEVIRRVRMKATGEIKEHRRKKTVGFVPARPFLRPALEGNEQRIVEIIAQNFRKHIDKVASG